MVTSVTITGSGNPGPSAERAGPGVLVRCEGLCLQFDAGRATVMRLAALGVRPSDLDVVFITHHHSDHLTGLADVVLTRWILDGGGEAGPLRVVAPAGPSARFVERLLDGWQEEIDTRVARHPRPRPSIDLRAFDVPPRAADGPAEGTAHGASGEAGSVHGAAVAAGAPPGSAEVWSSGSVRVLAAEMRHDPVRPAVGYRVETPDGTVVITGDTRVSGEVAHLAAGADVLVYEAMRFEAVLAAPSCPITSASTTPTPA